ncbi:MAG TPA: hypothetical protein PLV91_01460 [Verrucomicrobiota bacterium]|nr:hypothetical protein [Verrucomicrobiota bacterium]
MGGKMRNQIKKIFIAVSIIFVLFLMLLLSIPTISWRLGKDRRELIRERIIAMNSLKALHLEALIELSDTPDISDIEQLRTSLRDKGKLKEIETKYGESNLFFNPSLSLWKSSTEENNITNYLIILNLTNKYYVVYNYGETMIINTQENLNGLELPWIKK